MEKVKQMVAAGVSESTAIRQALGMSDADFAEKHGLNRSAVSNHISGRVRATDETIAALIAELGGTESEWRALLWMAAKPPDVDVRQSA